MSDPVTPLAGISADDFYAARGRATNAYADVERSLCELVELLADLRPKAAGIIFFKIVNSGTMYGILDKLMRHKYEAKYSLFWNSVAKALRAELTERRNQVVHWTVVGQIDDVKPAKLVLRPPNMYELGPNSPPPITTADLTEFIHKCDFYSRVVNTFVFHHHPKWAWSDEVRTGPWLDIFLQPVTYPPPDTHPLSRTRPAPGSRPPPSRE